MVRPTQDLSNPNNWPLGKVVAEKGFTTDTNGSAKLSFKLAAGAYRAVLETQDRFGKKVTGKLPAPGAAARGHEAGHQDSATAGRAGLGGAAGRGIHGAVGHGLRDRAGRSSRSSSGTR